MNVGLVLSGGGAKGAYQAGVVRALADSGIEVSVISGASIGSLNGGIISAARNISAAAERLEEVWAAISDIEPIQVDVDVCARYLATLVSFGLPGPGRAAAALSLIIADAIRGEEAGPRGVLKSDPLREMLNRYLEPEDLAQGKDLYVSLYPKSHHLPILKDFVTAGLLGRANNQESVFKHVQGLSMDQQIQSLMASAAFPIAFSPITVDGERYSDGGQGGYARVQGNTPITPLLGRNLDAIIVSHLSDGSLWDIEAFPGENILEIRPSSPISDNALDVLGFDEHKIRQWITAGREDTLALLQQVQRVAGARDELARATAQIQPPVSESPERKALDAVMRKLKQ